MIVRPRPRPGDDDETAGHAAVGATISVGLAALAEGEALDVVLARADTAMLAAKRVRGT